MAIGVSLFDWGYYCWEFRVYWDVEVCPMKCKYKIDAFGVELVDFGYHKKHSNAGPGHNLCIYVSIVLSTSLLATVDGFSRQVILAPT